MAKFCSQDRLEMLTVEERRAVQRVNSGLLFTFFHRRAMTNLTRNYKFKVIKCN